MFRTTTVLGPGTRSAARSPTDQQQQHRDEFSALCQEDHRAIGSNPTTVQAASLHPQGMMAPPTNALIVVLSLFAVLSVASAGDSLEATPMVVAKSGDDITLSFTVSNPSILDTVAVRVSWRAGPCLPSHHTLRTREVCKCVHALAHEAS